MPSNNHLSEHRGGHFQHQMALPGTSGISLSGSMSSAAGATVAGVSGSQLANKYVLDEDRVTTEEPAASAAPFHGLFFPTSNMDLNLMIDEVSTSRAYLFICTLYYS